ncbi:GGDEF domain-containing protein [Marilutibacter chinensis]|uniref:diguanylate cyclase n=1 Tax=Marilutibacter chinensis TaxID=2912247 RepID=A0ABS9HU06_9GAMM|nr:GGDEF domain-containing protein [Lysobacter chinensis]MCF7221793.1 GGDEF domain-containing protein [Lysobacter chinensis]MCF7223729.1 GGDEF domain-containing protein [Lysobacter chinensis]
MKPALHKLALAVVLAAAAAASAQAQDSVDADRLLEQADAVRSTDPIRFGAVLDEVNERASELSGPQLQHLRLLQAYRLGYGGQYQGAIELARDVFDSASAGAIKFRAGLLLANSAATTRDFSLALKSLEETIALPDDGIPSELVEQAQLVAGVIYNQLGQHEKTLQFASSVQQMEAASERSRCFASQLRHEALANLQPERSGERIPQIREAIAACDGIGEAVASNLMRINLARSMAAQGDRTGAIAMLQAHADEVGRTRYPRLVAEFHSTLADYLLIESRLDAASMHAHAALEASHNNAHSLPRVTAYRVLYEIALVRNDILQALDNYRRHAEADKAYLDDVKIRELAVQQIRNEVQQKDQAIALLSKQNEVLKLEQQVAKASAQNTRLLLLLFAVVLAGIGYWAYKIKRVQMAFRRQAQTDGLTGISNRRHFRDEADALLKRCSASGKDAALVLLDLDNFKHVNDRHGHAAGDWVLMQVAEACTAACRDGDLCGRLGGEEFGILSCGGDIDAARRIAERCRTLLAAIDTATIGHAHRVTASFGCTTASRSGNAFESMFTDADTAMYRAKGSGRDRIVVHGDVATPASPVAPFEPSHG